MSNIDKRAQKELYAKVEQQAHSLRGNPREYQALTGLCPVNVIEMHAQKIQALLEELEAAEKRIAELTDDCWIYEGTVKKLLERAEAAESACSEAARILESGERMALTRSVEILRAAAARKGE